MQNNNNNDQQEFHAEPFQNVSEVCQDASLRFGSDSCSCSGDDLDSVRVECSISTQMYQNISVAETVERGFLAQQEYCDDELCISLEYFKSYHQIAEYKRCRAEEHLNDNDKPSDHHNVRGGGRNKHTCRKRPNVCWDEQTMETSASGYVVEMHGQPGFSLLCFQEPAVPVLTHGLNSTVLHSSSSISSSAWFQVGTIFGILFAVFVCAMCCQPEDGPIRESRNRRLGRSYSGVQQEEDVEDAAASGDVEMTANDRQRARRQQQNQKKNLPVAVATPVQQFYESGEFDQRFPEGDDGFGDDSEEWTG